MAKRGRSKKINFNLSNRLSYTLIAIFLLAAVGIGVYALAPGVVPNPGHDINQMSVPSQCTADQFLKFNGSDWVCAVPSFSICPDATSLKYTYSYNEKQTNAGDTQTSSYSNCVPYTDTCNGDGINYYTCAPGETKTCQDSSKGGTCWVRTVTCTATLISATPYCAP